MQNEKDMHRLIALHLSGEIDPAGQQELDAWLDASQVNRDYFARARSLWESGQRLEATPDIDADWQKVSQRLGLNDAAPAKPNVMVTRMPQSQGAFWYLSRIAAVLVFGALLALGWRFWSMSTVTVVTAAAEQQTIELPDGSEVVLNHGSRLTYPRYFSGHLRHVLLEGEAFFDVVSGQVPFEVASGPARIRVLGTQFNVRNRNQETRVVVSEGRVAVNRRDSDRGEAVVLGVNQMTAVSVNWQPASEKVDAAAFTGWMNNIIYFEKTSVAEAIAELERAFAVSIEFQAGIDREQTITGRFRDQEVAAILSSICATLDLKLYNRNGGYVIGKE